MESLPVHEIDTLETRTQSVVIGLQVPTILVINIYYRCVVIVLHDAFRDEPESVLRV